MATFHYTAKRGIVRLDWSVEGSDIAFSGATGVITSTTTDLSGLSAGEFILVSGAEQAGNNGWYEVAAPSTAGGIETSGGSMSLETAGASVRITGYLHAPGRAYILETELERLDPERRVVRHSRRALSGRSETLRIRSDRIWYLRTDWVERVDQPLWDEFLSSVDGGETFYFDPRGGIDAPNSPREVELVDEAIRPERVGYTEIVSYDITVREVADEEL